MLGKLLKHEFKATARFFLPLFIAALIMTPVTRLITSIHIFDGYLAIIPGLFTGIYILILLAIAVVSYVIIIIRFYRNMVTDEGYLMHTLPVKASQHIWSKTLIACFWTIVSFAVIFLSLFAFFATPDRISTLSTEFSKFITMVQNELGAGVYTTFVIEIIILTIVGLFSNAFYVYASIAIGQVISRHRIIGAFAAAIVLNIINQILSTVLLVPIMLTTGINAASPKIMANAYIPASIVFTIIITIAYYCITNYVMTKKLNLE